MIQAHFEKSNRDKRSLLKRILFKVAKCLAVLSSIMEKCAMDNSDAANAAVQKITPQIQPDINKNIVRSSQGTTVKKQKASYQKAPPSYKSGGGYKNKAQPITPVISVREFHKTEYQCMKKDESTLMPGLDAKIICEIMEEYEEYLNNPAAYPGNYLDTLDLELADAYSSIYSWYGR